MSADNLHAVVVSCWDTARLRRIHTAIRDIAERHVTDAGRSCAVLVGDVVSGLTNGYSSFLIAPDGSKVGWGDREVADTFRNEVIAYLEGCDAAEDYSYWVEVRFGDDAPARVIHSDATMER